MQLLGVAVGVAIGDEVGVGVGEPPPTKLNLPMRVCQVPLWAYWLICQNAHAIRGIDFCPRIITPADATVESDSRKHDGFSLRKVTWRVSGETSGVPNRREDCRAGSGITHDGVSTLIHGYAGHPAP